MSKEEEELKKMIRMLIKYKKGGDLEEIRKKLKMTKDQFIKFACG